MNRQKAHGAAQSGSTPVLAPHAPANTARQQFTCGWARREVRGTGPGWLDMRCQAQTRLQGRAPWRARLVLLPGHEPHGADSKSKERRLRCWPCRPKTAGPMLLIFGAGFSMGQSAAWMQNWAADSRCRVCAASNGQACHSGPASRLTEDQEGKRCSAECTIACPPDQ